MNIDDKDNDFDFDDLDDELDDDLGDESWDEFDEDDSDLNEDTPASKSGDKTFVQKYFFGIVGGVVLCGAAIIFLGQGLMGGSAQPQSTTASVLPTANDQVEQAQSDSMAPSLDVSNEAIEFADGSDTLPMPTPMETVTNEVDLSSLNDIQDIGIDLDVQDETPLENDLSDDLLTPMPEISISADGTLNLGGVPEEPEMVDAQPIVDQINDVVELDEIEMEAPIEPANDLDILSNIIDNAPDAKPKDAVKAPMEATLPAEEFVIEQPIKVTESENIAVASVPNEKIEELERKINAVSDTLLEKVSDNEKKIDELIGLVQSLKEAQNSPQSTKTKAEPTRTQKPEKKKTVKKQPPKTSVKWVMRSAKPGEALVSQKGSNDLVSIEVGQYLPGIGKVTSIQPENGRWVIRGSKGLIRQ